ncbi:MAG TPA: zinc ribbon domain-containing protein [Candidatus Angelobacter sp.]
MFCPSCGKENANTSGFCNACGKPLPGAGVAPAAAPAPAPAAPGAAPRPAQSIYPPRLPIDTTQPMNAPAKRGPVAGVIVVILLAAAVGGFLYLRTIDDEKPEARIGRLMREAAGQQPIKKAFWSKNREFDDTFRDQYRNLFRINQEYLAAVKNADISAAAKLGSPESFADPASFTQGLSQLHAVYSLDMSQEEKVREVVGSIRHTIETGDWAASDREGVMKGFEAGLAVPLAKRQTAVSAEQAWVQSIDDVYNYAQQNHSVFVLNGGQLLISDNDVLQGFNSRMQTMSSRRTEFLQAKNDYDKFQADMFQKMGVTPKDMGMQ